MVCFNCFSVYRVVSKSCVVLSAVSLAVGLFACGVKTVSWQRCDASHSCAAGEVCGSTGECVAFVTPDCLAGASTCPSMAEGEACTRAGAFLPCSDSTRSAACDGGCHVCEGGVWSACKQELCTLGQLHSCAACTNDCTTAIVGKVSACTPNTDTNTHSCVPSGGCLPGFFDLNQDAADGCECQHSGKEVCDGQDNDCNGQVDEGDSLDGCQMMYSDQDGDGHGVRRTGQCLCQAPYAYVPVAGDCDDSPSLCGVACHAGAPEVCDGYDNDCDQVVDDGPDRGGCTRYYVDEDGDGVGSGTPVCLCVHDATHVADSGDDCDESDVFTYPGAAEMCDGLDNDCDGEIDEGATIATCRDFYVDEDNDGFGAGMPVCQCGAGGGYTRLNGTDCNDGDRYTYPGAPQLCDGNNNNCANATYPSVPANEVDVDGDRYVACVSWNDVQRDNLTILGGADCAPNDAKILPGAFLGCDTIDGWSCVAGTEACVPICGDGMRVGAEDDNHLTRCDDGNLLSGDGCSAACVIETGYGCTALATGGGSYCRKSCAVAADATFTGSSTLAMVATRVISTAAMGGSLLAVGSSTGFAVGDVVLLVTMQEQDEVCTTDTTVGAWELNEVTAVATGALSVRWPLRHDYPVATGNAPPSHQVVKVPSYRGVTLGSGGTLTAAAWDPVTKIGGVLALRAVTLTLVDGAKITMEQKGFRGGQAVGVVVGTAGPGPEGPLDDRVTGQIAGGRGGGDGGQGGSTGSPGTGQPGTYVAPNYFGGGGGHSGNSGLTAALGACGGGGGGNASGSGGSGGADAGSGGKGKASQDAAGGGGCPYHATTCSDRLSTARLLLGAGGAAGASGGCAQNAGAGGAGGKASGYPDVTGTGTARRFCATSTTPNTAGSDGGPGGGLIVLLVRQIVVGSGGASVVASGGQGGAGGVGQTLDSSSYHGFSGGGGGGGAAGAGGGSIVIATGSVSGGTLTVNVSGGSGGNGGDGGDGTCGLSAYTVSGGAGGAVSTPIGISGSAGTTYSCTGFDTCYCGGGGGGGRLGPTGDTGVLYVTNASFPVSGVVPTVPSELEPATEPYLCPP